jgi:hypothetical protein
MVAGFTPSGSWAVVPSFERLGALDRGEEFFVAPQQADGTHRDGGSAYG